MNIKLATVGHSNIKKDVIGSGDFINGKKGDTEAAERIVNQIWRDYKTEQLQEEVSEKAIFVSLPSTSSTNIIPFQLSLKLSKSLNCECVNGDELFNVAHEKSSKDIPRDKRVFHKRDYESDNPEKTKALLSGKEIIIVDDIITTGSSIRNFKEFLEVQNFQVAHAVGLMGERRLALDSTTKEKLEKLLKDKKTDIDINTIDYITRAEAGGLIRTLNSLNSENGIGKFTRDLRGIQREGITSDIGRNTSADRNSSAKRENISNEEAGKKISINSGPPDTDKIKDKEIEV